MTSSAVQIGGASSITMQDVSIEFVVFFQQNL